MTFEERRAKVEQFVKHFDLPCGWACLSVWATERGDVIAEFGPKDKRDRLVRLDSASLCGGTTRNTTLNWSACGSRDTTYTRAFSSGLAALSDIADQVHTLAAKLFGEEG